MITEYDIGDCVLLKGVVKAIRLDEKGKIYYLITIKGEESEYKFWRDIAVIESDVVCGWIKERSNE